MIPPQCNVHQAPTILAAGSVALMLNQDFMPLVLGPQVNQHVPQVSSVVKVKIRAQTYQQATSQQEDNTQQFVQMVGTPMVAQIPAIFAQLDQSAEKMQSIQFHQLSFIHNKVTPTKV